MISQAELAELGIPVRKSPAKSIVKSEKSQIPVQLQEGVIQWVDAEVVEKALEVQEKTLDARERMMELRGRKNAAIRLHDLKSYIVDPYDMYEYSKFGQIRAKRNLSFDALRMMADTEIPAAIITTRIAQATRYSRPTKPEMDELGFNIRTKDRDYKATNADKKRMTELEEFLANTGWEKGYVGFAPRDDFKAFLTKILRDRLTFDKVNIELEFNRKHDINAFFAVDAATIFPVVPRYMKEIFNQGKSLSETLPEYLNQKIEVDDICYVQKIYGQDCAYYTREEMISVCENVRSDIRFYGYGVSELELLIKTVTAWINGLTFSTSTFNENRLPSGVISLVGNYTTEDLQSFKDDFYLSMQNPAFKHRVPIMRTKDGDGIKFVEFKGKNATSEEQHKFLTFMAQLCGALYRIDVEELGFQSLRMGAAPLQQASPVDKIKGSKDKGFEPLMQFVADIINRDIISKFDDGKYVFEWVGIKDDRTKEKLEIRKLRLETGVTVRQLLTENDEDEPEGEHKEWLDAPANPTLFQAWNMERMGKQQQQQMGGMGGAEGGGEGGEAGAESQPGAEAGESGAEGQPGAGAPEAEPHRGLYRPMPKAGGEEEIGKSLSLTVRRVNARAGNRSI